MSFPDGRVKEGIFENNIYKAPSANENDQKQLKAQETLIKQSEFFKKFDKQNPNGINGVLPQHSCTEEREYLNSSVQPPNDISKVDISVGEKLATI
jgi:hypothetical protein